MSKNTTDKQVYEQSKSFVKWIQEFSKKIVSVTFVIFVIINVYILSMISISYYTTGELMCLDTLITESNLTFREVIGGYIIKAATENAIKIAGSIAEKYIEFIANKKYKVEEEDDFDIDISEDDPMLTKDNYN